MKPAVNRNAKESRRRVTLDIQWEQEGESGDFSLAGLNAG
jgi:hypothetical protein